MAAEAAAGAGWGGPGQEGRGHAAEEVDYVTERLTTRRGASKTKQRPLRWDLGGSEKVLAGGSRVHVASEWSE